jgi:hypothetical protein
MSCVAGVCKGLQHSSSAPGRLLQQRDRLLQQIAPKIWIVFLF